MIQREISFSNMFLDRLFRFSIPRLTVVMLFALDWSNLAFCGEIHEAAEDGYLTIGTILLVNQFPVIPKP